MGVVYVRFVRLFNLCAMCIDIGVFERAQIISYGRGLMVLLAGGGILQKPAASKTGSNSRTRPGMLPSSMLYIYDDDVISL